MNRVLQTQAKKQFKEIIVRNPETQEERMIIIPSLQSVYEAKNAVHKKRIGIAEKNRAEEPQNAYAQNISQSWEMPTSRKKIPT